MLFFQDDKDKLKQELENMSREIQASKNVLRYHWDLIQELTAVTNGIKNIYPHGAKKDGTPRAKPGRKPKGVKA